MINELVLNTNSRFPEFCVSSSESLKFRIGQPKNFSFEPQADITPLEAAWLAHFWVSLPFLVDAEAYDYWEFISRHFKVEESLP